MSPSKGRTLTIVIAVMAIVPMAPAMVLSAMGFPAAILPWSLAALGGTMATMFVGWRLGLALTGALAIFGSLAFAAGQWQNPWMAGLVMGVFAFGYGYTSRWGISSNLIIAVVAIDMITATGAAIVDDQSITTNALLTGAILVAAGLWGILIGLFLSRYLPKTPRTSLSMEHVWSFAIIMAVILGAAMAVVVAQQWQHGGAWFVLTLVVILQPDYMDSVKKIAHRALGTILGFAIALAIVSVIHVSWLVTLLGFAFLAVAMVFIMRPGSPYWVFVTFLTPAIVLMESNLDDAVSVDVARLGFTLLGVAVAALVALAFYPLQKRVPAPDPAPATAAPTS
ncbi:MAG: FUSC family protein [Candidatus Nanopelagicales bacterium]